MLLVMLLALVAGVFATSFLQDSPALGGLIMTISIVTFVFVLCGFYMQQPNQATAITLFGAYKGTDRNTGLRWVLPWLGRRRSRSARTT